jgi:hypothetical protein
MGAAKAAKGKKSSLVYFGRKGCAPVGHQCMSVVVRKESDDRRTNAKIRFPVPFSAVSKVSSFDHIMTMLLLLPVLPAAPSADHCLLLTS